MSNRPSKVEFQRRSSRASRASRSSMKSTGSSTRESKGRVTPRTSYGGRSSQHYSTVLKAGSRRSSAHRSSRRRHRSSRSSSIMASFAVSNADVSQGDDEEGGSEELGEEELSGEQEDEAILYCGEDESGEEICEEEEEDIEEESTEEGSSPELTAAELDMEKELERTRLVETYLIQQQQFRFLKKKNAYLEDKLYRLLLRKGIISEEEDKARHDISERRKKRKKKQHIVLHIHSKDELHQSESSMLKPLSDVELDRQRKSRILHKGQAATKSRMYRSKLEHLIQLRRTESQINESMTLQLGELKTNFEASESKCTLFLEEFLERISDSSRKAIHSNWGTPLKPEETKHCLEEIRTLFNKLRRAILLFYKTWHGLNWDLQRLEETEVKDSGLSMLEYEQLQGENLTLKDKAEYQEQELEKQRKKIASAVQILAHVREKENRLDDQIMDGISTLSDVTAQLKDYAEQMDSVTQHFAGLRAEQQKLQEQSGLMDNVKLLRDYEKTTGKLNKMKEQKRKIATQTKDNFYEIQSLQSQIMIIKSNLPKLQKMAAVQARKTRIDNKNRREEEARRSMEHDTIEQMKLERLLQLLEVRHDEPWKQVQETIIRPDYFTTSAGATVTTVSC